MFRRDSNHSSGNTALHLGWEIHSLGKGWVLLLQRQGVTGVQLLEEQAPVLVVQRDQRVQAVVVGRWLRVRAGRRSFRKTFHLAY
jgi:hypothetical protein